MGVILKNLGGKKGALSKSKKTQSKKTQVSHKMESDKLTNEINTLKKYRKRIAVIPEGLETLGSGIYTQPKRNAYKINMQTGGYGNLEIDLPKLLGQLELIAYRDGKKVYHKKADFDTIDLITKRYNSKKKYSDISKMIFNELNQISEIPIHRTSNKFKKMGPGVIYFNDPKDLMDRLELLGGAINAGNDGVKEEFSRIAHTLNKLGVISNKQLNDLFENI